VVLNDRVLTVSTLGFGRNAGILIVRNLLEDAHRAQEIAPHFQVWRIPLYGLRRKDLLLADSNAGSNVAASFGRKKAFATCAPRRTRRNHHLNELWSPN
jgi:hypothetical protein